MLMKLLEIRSRKGNPKVVFSTRHHITYRCAYSKEAALLKLNVKFRLMKLQG